MSSRPSPISTHTADATIGFVAENTQKRLSSVAAPNVSKHSISSSRATATWHAGVAPLSTSAPAASRSSEMLIGGVFYGVLSGVQEGSRPYRATSFVAVSASSSTATSGPTIPESRPMSAPRAAA